MLFSFKRFTVKMKSSQSHILMNIGVYFYVYKTHKMPTVRQATFSHRTTHLYKRKKCRRKRDYDAGSMCVLVFTCPSAFFDFVTTLTVLCCFLSLSLLIVVRRHQLCLIVIIFVIVTFIYARAFSPPSPPIS